MDRTSHIDAPERIEIRDGGRRLGIVWASGAAADLTAALLRAECRSAGARRARIDDAGRAARPPEDIRIVAVTPIGHYAVNIAFSDGQDRGIYPWGYLADLARQAGD